MRRYHNMCNVLMDVEKAETMVAESAKETSRDNAKMESRKVTHPTEAQYASLNAELQFTLEGDEKHEVIKKAFSNTKGRHKGAEQINTWRVERKGEAERFKSFKLNNHKLLWHRSHIGTISATLATGLRTMPHSGGRVGKGIYLASESGKSLDYMTPACRKIIGSMFLVEAALAKTCEITQDNCSLMQAPRGYDSVRACGRQMPCGLKNIKLDDKMVNVAVERPALNPKTKSSCFINDKSLIYNTAQVRVLYVLTVRKV